MSNLPSIGSMVLYKNEITHLERLVPKVLEAFDEAVFVTNLEPSTDGSDELLAKHGVKPHRMKWVEDFSVARQFGLDRSTTDYTMWMDCDDDLVTTRASLRAAGEEARRFLGETRNDYYIHRIHFAGSTDYWARENWFRRGCGVRVKYPTHEVYLCDGTRGIFPPGVIDRMNDPLKADYAGKLWRYFDMLWRYLRDVDPGDPRCRFYLAREFRGPPEAAVALYLSFFDAARKRADWKSFCDECTALMNLFESRAHVPARTLLELSEELTVRHPFEFMAHVLYCMIRCELEPSPEIALRFYALVQNRMGYETDRAPFSLGWYYDRALNCCGYYLFRASVKAARRDLAEKAVEILGEANRPGCYPGIADVVKANLKVAANWLAGFPTLSG